MRAPRSPRDEYFKTPAWSEADRELVGGRPVLIWRQRLRGMLDLLELAPRAADQPLLVCGERRITFAQFHAAVASAAARFAGLGIGPGDRVLVIGHNSPELFLAPWALWRAGAVPVLGNRWWSPAEIRAAAERVRPAAVITDVEGMEAIVPAPAVLASQLRECWTAGAPASEPPPPATVEDDLALILFTAGSTGPPKGVQLSHRNLIATHHNARVMATGGAWRPVAVVPDPQPAVLLTIPLFHYGALRGTVGALLDGARIVMPEGKFDPVEVLRLIEKERVAAWNAVPTMHKRVLDHPDFSSYDLSSLASPATGGAMVPRALVEAIPDRYPGATGGLRVAWGMSECGTVTIASGHDLKARPGTVGRVITNVEVRIDAPLPDGEGECLVRSAQTMIGYLDAESQPFDGEGWYHTGDLGRLDADGYVYITGRKSDMVIRGGENISCPNVEAAINEHPEVLESAAVGVSDDDLGEALAAVVVIREGAAVSPEALERFVRDRLAYFEVPTSWTLTTEPLPTLASGKVDKRRLQSVLAAGAPS